MNIYNEEKEFNVTHIPVFQRVVDMYQGRADYQQIFRLGLLAKVGYGDELDDSDDDNYKYDHWVHDYNNSHRYPRPSDRSNDRGSGGNYTRSPGSAYRPPQNYYTLASDPRPPPSGKVQAKESDTERRARLLQEAKKSKEKAEKKRLKKQKQKQRKQLEKLEKEKQNPAKTEEEKNDGQKSTADESKPVNDKSNSTVKDLASAKDTESSDSSEVESSDEDSDAKNDFSDSEELDMTSTFVSKAALIARRKLEKKSRPENKEKKKTPVKEEPKTVPDKQNEDPKAEKKDPPSPGTPTVEDNIKISTDLANIGNRFASAGDFNMAVKYFTNAIKYNPKEFKLFGNRSFCFEKMQEYAKALIDAELCLTMCPGWVKGLFRKGRALAGLKRYDEAAEAFREVLKVDSSCAEAAQELMRVQIIQLMGYGFTREQSSNALIIHGTVEKAVEVLSQLNPHQGVVHNGSLPLAQVANVSGVSPVLSANTSPGPHQSQGAPKTPLQNKPLGPVQNVSNLKSQPKPGPNLAVKATDQDNHLTQELFPVWVGNLFFPVTETVIANIFNKVGNVYSVKVLTYRRCAFVNYTKQEHCEEAIRRFHGYDLNGVKIAVRYPDRIPKGMGISKSALRADDLQDENVGQNEYANGRNAVGSRRPGWPQRPPLDHRSNQSSTSANCLK